MSSAPVRDPAAGTHEQLLASAASSLSHLGEIVRGLSDDQYVQESKALPGSTIGKHVRHVLDHFTLLLGALAKADEEDATSTLVRDSLKRPLGPVSYSHRERNRSTESTVACGLEGIARVTGMIEGVGQRTRAAPAFITIRDTLPGGTEASYLSTADRELWFCIHHMVHHNAIIASLMYEFGLDPPTEFAYAPSTIKHAHRG
ncbi:hypothetical protein LPJ61_004152 [Coemansia biformis]|uniref:DinB-like domain-containing protein n=1 Tax=Coemansia biformis TaxID=1286918 RepID=A0A9W7Y965_9FUNG|nr:hypothetical protein LPJ61_004152 [Coemansia biformis]